MGFIAAVFGWTIGIFLFLFGRVTLEQGVILFLVESVIFGLGVLFLLFLANYITGRFHKNSNFYVVLFGVYSVAFLFLGLVFLTYFVGDNPAPTISNTFSLMLSIVGLPTVFAWIGYVIGHHKSKSSEAS